MLFFYVYMPHFDIILGCQRSYGSCSPTSLPQIIFCNSNNCIAISSVLCWMQTILDLLVLKEREVLSSTFFFHIMLDLQFPTDIEGY